MAVKISELPILDSLADNDVIAGVDTSANVTSKIEMATLKNYIDTNTQYTAGTNIDITNNVVSAPNVYNKTETDELLEEKDGQIEELQSEIDSLSMIYNAFPTESGEGESLTLDDTAEVKFKKFDLKGNTSQTTYSGKNLFDKSNYVDNYYISSTGELVAENGNFASYYIPVSSGNYIISGADTEKIIRCAVYDSNQTFIRRELTTVATSLAITISNDEKYVRVSGYKVDSNTFQLEKGSTATSYEPYVGGTASPNPNYPQPVNVVSGDNEINVVGKNLLENQYLPIPSADNTATYEVKNAYLSQGTYTLATTDNSTFGNTVYVKLFKEDKQVVKESGHLSTSNGNYSTNTYNYFIGTADNLTYIQFTIDDNYYARIGLLNSNNTKEVMLVKGTEIVRTYEPYQGNTYNIDLPVENLCDVILDSSISGDISYKTYTFEPNTQYTISTNTWVTSSSTANIFASAGTSFSPSSATNGVNGSRTITSDSNGKITIGYRNVNLSLDYSSGNYYIQIEKGTKANSYTPYGTTPIELCKIGNYQDEFRKSTGKNLLQSGYRQGNTTSTTATNRLFTTHSVYVEANKTYTISTNINVSSFYWAIRVASSDYPATADITTGDWNTTSSQTYTPTQNGYLAVIIGKRDLNANISESEIGNTYFQVEVGGNATDPEPYGKGKWYKYGAIGKVVLNGSENWGLQSINNYGIANFVYDNTGAYSSGSYVRSNYFKNQNTTIGGTTESGIFNNANSIYIRIDQTIANTVANFKTWLSTHNTIVYYVLATPTNTEITYRPLIDQLNLLEKAMSKDGQTNISQVSNDKPFILDVTAIKSLQNVLDRIELLES